MQFWKWLELSSKSMQLAIRPSRQCCWSLWILKKHLSARWVNMLLSTSWASYRDYLEDRQLSYDTKEGKKSRCRTSLRLLHQHTCLTGCFWWAMQTMWLQWSLQGPLIWLNCAWSRSWFGWANGWLVMNWSGHKTNFNEKINKNKTEILIMITWQRIPKAIPMTVGGVEVQTKLAVWYLGVMLDCRIKWWEHIQMTCELCLSEDWWGTYAAPEVVKGDFSCPPATLLFYTAQKCERAKKYSKHALA